MLAESGPTEKSLLKNPLVYSSTVLLIVMLYVGYILISRRQENRGIERRAQEQQAATRQREDRATLE